jgi:hypothetical protein
MTTKVKITLAQPHMPVVVEVNGSEVALLLNEGDSTEQYVHSAQQLTVRELSTGEVHARDPR